MTAIDESQMHRDHVNWNSEIAMWLQDARMWHQELEALKNALKSIKTACESHEKGLDAHLVSVKKHQHFFKVDESRLAMVPPGGNLNGHLTALHNKKGQEQQILRDAHARLKQYHHLIMILTKQMKKLLEGPI